MSKRRNQDAAFKARVTGIRVCVDVGGSRELSELFRRIESGPALTGDEQGLVEAHLARLAEMEARNLKAETDLQADGCHNADRIMRLPKTVNLPGEKKRSKGRMR